MAAHAPPMDATLAEELHRLIGRSRRMLWMASARSLEARGESVFTWHALCYLVRNGPTGQQDLAMANAQDPAGMSRLLEELEERGFVRRKPDPKDRRRAVVEATTQGAAWFRGVSPTVVGAVGEVLRGLSPEQQKALKGLLEALAGPLCGPPVRARGAEAQEAKATRVAKRAAVRPAERKGERARAGKAAGARRKQTGPAEG